MYIRLQRNNLSHLHFSSALVHKYHLQCCMSSFQSPMLWYISSLCFLPQIVTTYNLSSFIAGGIFTALVKTKAECVALILYLYFTSTCSQSFGKVMFYLILITVATLMSSGMIQWVLLLGNVE